MSEMNIRRRATDGMRDEEKEAVDRMAAEMRRIQARRAQREAMGPAPAAPGMPPAPATGSGMELVPGQGAPGQAPMPGSTESQAMAASGQAQPTTDLANEITGSRITEDILRKAIDTLKKYKDGKASLERRVVSAQQWWKLQNWAEIEKTGVKGSNANRTGTPWLWNCIVGKHADAMDSFPEPVILPRVRDDKEEADRLTDILPVILEINGFEETYSKEQWQKFIEGTGIYGDFWDKDMHNGLGDIAIKNVSVLNLFWEPGISDIQDSQNVFHVALVDNELIEEMWPVMRGKLKGAKYFNVKEYKYDDRVDTSEKSLVIDWYYHKRVNGRKVLHYCKFCGETVIYSSEDDPATRDRGFYDDGLYPFVFDPLYPIEGSPCGYGLIDIAQGTQKDIDLINQALVTNAVVSATPRHFIRDDGGVNEEEMLDTTKPFVHVKGILDDRNIRRIEAPGIPSNTITVMQELIDQIKWTTGNTDVQNGSAPSGVTAASALAALREDAGRSSKDSTKAGYRACSRLYAMTIERVRQFYSLSRQFRITGPRGQERYVEYSNERLVAQAQGFMYGQDMGFRLPAFDIHVHAQRENAYTKASNNELALQLYQLGFFNPQMADQAIMALDMMDFRDREELQKRIREQHSLQQTAQALCEIAMNMAMEIGDPNAIAQVQQVAAALGMQPQMPAVALPGGGDISKPQGELAGPDERYANNPIAQRAAERAAQASRVD